MIECANIKKERWIDQLRALCLNNFHAISNMQATDTLLLFPPRPLTDHFVCNPLRPDATLACVHHNCITKHAVANNLLLPIAPAVMHSDQRIKKCEL